MPTTQPDYEIQYDSLALGLTRPPVFFGVSTLLFFVNVMLGMIICVFTKTAYGAVLFVVLHLIMARLSAKEPKFFSLWQKAFTKTPPVLNAYYWGKTNSYEPW
jgi:type IV secretion system protein VirB3